MCAEAWARYALTLNFILLFFMWLSRSIEIHTHTRAGCVTHAVVRLAAAVVTCCRRNTTRTRTTHAHECMFYARLWTQSNTVFMMGERTRQLKLLPCTVRASHISPSSSSSLTARRHQHETFTAAGSKWITISNKSSSSHTHTHSINNSAARPY